MARRRNGCNHPTPLNTLTTEIASMSDHDSTTAVEYRPIAGFPGFFLGSDTSAWSQWGRGSCVDSGNPRKMVRLKLSVRNNGYVTVGLRRKGEKQIAFYVHRLMLETFVGPCPDGMECRHLDGNPKNNSLGNLAWGTKKQNGEDRISHGTRHNGERSPISKLTDENVREIRKLSRDGLTQYEIASRFGIVRENVSAILVGRTWKHVE